MERSTRRHRRRARARRGSRNWPTGQVKTRTRSLRFSDRNGLD